MIYVSADEPTLRGRDWLAQQWDAARLAARKQSDGAIFVIDEVQKISNWSEIIKRYWDEDSRNGTQLKIVLLGSAPLLVARGMTESLAGRFEILHLPHWSYSEMHAAFNLELNQYLYFGGYPGAISLIGDPERWRRYMVDSLIETSISRDVLLMTRIDKPALLRQLFDLACLYSGQILSYNKMLGQLQDAGNTTTLAHYLTLLSGAGMVKGVPKFTIYQTRSRASSPKLQVLNTGLMSALKPDTQAEAQSNHEYWGRLIESAIGAHLTNAEASGVCEVFYWRERSVEVDFVVRYGQKITAIEVKSSNQGRKPRGALQFEKMFKPHRSLLIGGDGISIDEFLRHDVKSWVT